ncbi:MAE_28990/MAE_18760 family HEPN-like nuclease [Streptomyces sp. EMB24]|uniref:MAE_28990/MAE_18760 family HEPN-like nuclease n=1 Tax=Streptomyces sp. EMB24 TaxID=2835531 RepID=UPI00227A6779|nr:MAE_28990/MAE_18760 family HEPN-like nuclease [Streptomyces sp. EMB24]
MSTADLFPFFEERFGEVDSYIDFLEKIEEATQNGIPRIAVSEYRITAKQQRILYSSVYLQLYNLVEATMARCVSELTEATSTAGRWQPHQLNDNLLQEWVRSTARTHADMSAPNRLKHALEMSTHIVQQLPIKPFVIDVGGGGNWDDEVIYRMAERLGCRLSLTSPTQARVKRKRRDGLGPLQLVKDRRNGLAHGSISFVDCADGVVVRELREMSQCVEAYLREVIACFKNYIDSYNFLRPDSRPSGDTA